MENWKAIEGYEGYYEVSDLGRIRSLDRYIETDNFRRKFEGKILKGRKDSTDHHMVSLYGPNGKRDHNAKVHRLVLIHFIGHSDLMALHRDGNPNNNRLDNLYWGTSSENTLDQVRHGTHKESSKGSCPRGHLLVDPNLSKSPSRKGKRICLACSRARSYASRILKDTSKIQELSDDYYDKIMTGEPNSVQSYKKIQTCCLRGHLLLEPNLVKYELKLGKRKCLSCAKAHSYLRRRDGEDIQVVSDRYYLQMKGCLDDS